VFINAEPNMAGLGIEWVAADGRLVGRHSVSNRGVQTLTTPCIRAAHSMPPSACSGTSIKSAPWPPHGAVACAICDLAPVNPLQPALLFYAAAWGQLWALLLMAYLRSNTKGLLWCR